MRHASTGAASGRTESRRSFVVDEPTVSEYRAVTQAGAQFPPLDLVETPDGALCLVDGFHRAGAAEREAVVTLDACVWTGRRDEAIEFACASNAKHGPGRRKAE